ncbi:sulfatase family protein [Cohnella fermenti]|uniref:sulfatase family protein n=1 Tax=Cohnella fermenti TaxID=2565925 RepID=UPI001E2B571A|nr:sulfatase/phosphatase domain-containing protein [Cohnella fermenti]
MDTLKSLGIEDEVVWVISADHGESMGEQGIYMEHASATEAVHHLPLIIKIPGITQPGKVYEQFVYNVDVIASITDLIGLNVPQGWDGRSFMPILKTEAAEEYEARPYLVMDHGLNTCQRAIRDARWYFIRTYHPGFYRFDDVTLYDMENDPHQLHNVASHFPEIVHLMDHRIQEWLQEQQSKHGLIMDPMQEVIRSGPWRYVTPEAWAERLRSEGREAEADSILEKWRRNHFE